MTIIKKHWKSFLRNLFLLIIIYLAGGALLSSMFHRDVTDEFKDSFEVTDYYAESTGTERVLCIDDNVDALLWRLRVIESAKNEIILSTFEMRDDNSGQDIMAALLQAADRGVHVRMIVDGMTGQMRLSGSDNFNALLAHPNVEAKLYNPINLLTPWELSFRLHDKYLIADNSVYILGGRNTYDLFLGDYVEKMNIDRDLLVYETGAADEDTSLAQVRTYFDSIWELPCSKSFTCRIEDDEAAEATAFLNERYGQLKEIYPEAFEETDYVSATVETNKISLIANPQEASNREPELFYTLTQLMAEGENVVIQTPYIICSSYMYRNLTEICDGSTNLDIITNAVESGANPWGCTDYLNQKKKLSGTGATIYEFLGESSSHTKTVLIDDHISIVGSYNFDMRSTYLDTEMMLVVDSTALNEQLQDNVTYSKLKSKQVSPDGTIAYGEDYEPVEMTWKKKIYYAVMRVVIIPIRYML